MGLMLFGASLQGAEGTPLLTLVSGLQVAAGAWGGQGQTGSLGCRLLPGGLHRQISFWGTESMGQASRGGHSCPVTPGSLEHMNGGGDGAAQRLWSAFGASALWSCCSTRCGGTGQDRAWSTGTALDALG